MIVKRIFFGIVLIGAVFYAPWWMTFLFALGGAFYFSHYYEVIVSGVVFDILYGVTGSPFGWFGLMGLIVGSVIFFGVERAKHELRT